MEYFLYNEDMVCAFYDDYQSDIAYIQEELKKLEDNYKEIFKTAVLHTIDVAEDYEYSIANASALKEKIEEVSLMIDESDSLEEAAEILDVANNIFESVLTNEEETVENFSITKKIYLESLIFSLGISLEAFTVNQTKENFEAYLDAYVDIMTATSLEELETARENLRKLTREDASVICSNLVYQTPQKKKQQEEIFSPYFEREEKPYSYIYHRK